MKKGNLVLNYVFLCADISGQPYRAPGMRDAIKEVVNLDDVLFIGRFQMSHVWMVTCANAATKGTLCGRGELTMNRKRCNVVDTNTRDIKMKLFWLTPCLENRRAMEAL